MSAPLIESRNGLWDRVLVDALLACGVRRVVLCPGGRNSLLALTLDRTPGMACLQHVDERSAAFLALGQSLADGQPTAVCTTSGSAVANLLPALAEASARGARLVVVTCDRPLSGRRAHEPQTLPQADLCTPLVRQVLALPDPLSGGMDLVGLRQAVKGALGATLYGGDPGPLQINLPQWGAYCATEEDPPGTVLPALPPAAPPLAPAAPVQAGAAEVRAALAALAVGQPRRSLMVVGADCPLPPSQVVALAEQVAMPVLSDVCSGLRQADLPHGIACADALAISPLVPFGETEFVLRLGATPVSPGMQRALKGLDCPVLAIAAQAVGGDFLTPQAVGLAPPDGQGLAALAEGLGQGDAAWLGQWQDADRAAERGRAAFLDQARWGEVQAAALVCAAEGFDWLHLGNSLSVRYAGVLAPPSPQRRRVFSARGANGTDGTLGLILGECLVQGGRVLALLGDQTFTHDLPALANPLWRQQRGALCVMNNGGGALFDMVPASRIAGYEQTMRNPPAVEFAGVAQAFGLVHRPCCDAGALSAALAEAAHADHLSLIEIKVGPGTSARDLPPLMRSMVMGMALA